MIGKLMAGLFALVLTLGWLGAGSTPAWAHAALTASDPADGATVDSLPPALTLTFNEDLIATAGTTRLEVLDQQDGSLTTEGPTVSGDTVTQPLAGWPSGPVSVRWRTVSADGHPINGEFSFTVTGTPEPADTAPTATTTAPAPTDAGTPSPAASPEVVTMSADPVPGWLMPAVVALVLLAGGGVLVARRRSR